VERRPELAQLARVRLDALGYGRVRAGVGDGALGWPEAAPFDAILVTAAAPAVPAALTAQLAVGGRLVAPLGQLAQGLYAIERTAHGLDQRALFPVRFVPLV